MTQDLDTDETSLAAWIAQVLGDMGEPGPVYFKVPTDVLRTLVAEALIPEDWLTPEPRRARGLRANRTVP